MTRLEVLRKNLYNLCSYDADTDGYLTYNKLLWEDIQKLKIGAAESAIKKLMECKQ